MATWHFDEGYHYDASEETVIEAEMTVEMEHQHIHNPFSTLVIEAEMDIDVDWIHAVELDLLQLIPRKHHSQQVLLDYVDEVELQIGSWMTAVRDMNRLGNPNSVTSREYLKKLATLIGLNLPPEDDSTEDEIRRSISQAIDWYKIKGTYKSIVVIALIQKFTVNLYDMYTNDYEHFYLTDWFVGEENENPPGFDASYYKSPHFGVEILLDQVYSGGSGSGASGASGASGGSGGPVDGHLWKDSYLNNFYNMVESTRPVHTVPHFVLFLNPKTDEFGHVIEVEGDIQTKVFADWEATTKYFDTVGTPWYFDDLATYFDELITSFIYSITKWVLGSGSSNIHSASWTPTAVLTGTIDPDDISITNEKVTFSFIVPKNISQNAIKELALYTSTNELVVGSVFPNIEKGSRTELKVTVEVYKSDLSS